MAFKSFLNALESHGISVYVNKIYFTDIKYYIALISWNKD